MKQQAAQKPAAAEQKRRASATNTHERQAREVATRLLDGEQDAARLLTAVPAARRVEPRFRASRAESLPASLRDWLEPGFGADLSAVRVHHDALAAEVAAREGARAFASGRDLFFGAGEYQPGQLSGQRLIVHEVAHVLQQAGRKQADGTLVVVDTHGSADVQREEFPWNTFRRGYESQIELADPTVKSAVNTLITELETLVGASAVLSPTLGEGATIIAFEQRVRDGEFNGHDRIARSLLMDLLKLLGRYDGAAYLLTRDATLPTAFPQVAFRDFLRDNPRYGVNWITSAFNSIPAIRDVFPGRYLDAIWQYLTQPVANPGEPRGYTDIARTFATDWEARLRTNFFKDNERVYMAYQVLGDLGQILASDLQGMETQLRELHPNPVARRRAAAQMLLGSEQSMANNSQRVYQELGPQIMLVARMAMSYWNASQALYDEIFRATDQLFSQLLSSAPAGSQPGTPPTAVAVPQPPPELLTSRTYSAFGGFVAGTRTALQTLMGGITPVLLGPAAYAEAIGTVRTALINSRGALSTQIAALYSRTAATTQPPGETVEANRLLPQIWYGLAQYFIEQLIVELNAYDLSRDNEFMTRYGGLEDVRLRHRYRVADFGLMLARMTGDTAFAEQMTGVMRGADLGRSYLAFTGTWVKDEVPSDRLQSDFGSIPVASYGLRPGQIGRLYYLLYEQTLVAALREVLSQYGNDLTPESYGLIQRALRLTRERMPMPERWKAVEYVLVWNEADTDPQRRTVGTLIEGHPRFQELLDIGTHRQDGYITPNDRRNDVFVWFLPNFQRVIDYLNTIPAMRELLESFFLETVTPDNLLHLLGDLEYLTQEERGQRRAQAGQGETLPLPSPYLQRFLEALGVIDTTLTGAIQGVQMQRDTLFTQATIHDRRTVEAACRSLLGEYAADSSIENYSKPTQVLELIERFRSDMRSNRSPGLTPEQQAAADRVIQDQIAALILNIAPEMVAAFTSTFLGTEFTEKRYDIITGYFGLIAEGLALANDANAAARLQPILHSSEAADTLIARREHLISLRERFLVVIHEIQRRFGMRTTSDRQGLQRIGYDRVLPLNKEFTIDGITYMITDIHTVFTFHDAYGRGTAAEQPPIIEGPNGEAITPESNTELLTFIMVSVGTDGQEHASDPITIRSRMTETELTIMERLSRAVTMALIVEGLNQLADTMEQAMRIGIEAAALAFPPGAIALTIAEFTYFVATELPTIQAELLDAPRQVVTHIRDFVSPERRGEMLEVLWTFLLFEGDLPFQEALQARLMTGGAASRSPGRRRSRAASSGRFSRLVAFARRVGERLLAAFFNLRQRIAGGLILAHRTIMRHPLLARLLRSLPMMFEFAEFAIQEGPRVNRLAEVLTGESDTALPVSPRELSSSLSEAFNELFAGLSGMLAPEEIIPMELVYTAIIDRFVGSFGARGRIVRTFLEKTGLDFELGLVIKQELRSRGYDPNLLWQDVIQRDLQGMLHAAQVELAEGINATLAELFGNDLQITVPTEMPTVEIDRTQPELDALPDDDLDEVDEEDEVDAAQSDPHRVAPRAPQVDVGGGLPLSPGARARYEERYGHNFAHVRIHRGRKAARLTEHYGAHALTSGSHIFLSRKLSPGGGRYDEVMRHELAHVLQQTGARPLSYEHDPEPVRGEPGRGLHHNTRRERAAERMARQALAPHTTALTIEEEGGLGLQPALSRRLRQQVLAYLTSDQLADSLEQQVESMRAVPAAVARMPGFSQAARQAQTIWNQARQSLTRRSPPAASRHDHAPPFNRAREAIAVWFNGHALDTQRIRALTFLSFDQTAGNRAELNRVRFINNLTSYIYADMGVDLQIDKGRTQVDWARVVNVHPGRIDGHSRMYTDMRDNTNAYRAGLAPAPTPWRDRDWERIRRMLRGGVSGEVEDWHATEYRLSDDKVDALNEHLLSFGAMSVDTWAKYIDPNAVGGTTGGLRVGTHGQLTGQATPEPTRATTGPQSAIMTARGGRQSHHVPQFLLVQYFQNLNARKVHRGNRVPPGFTGPLSRLTGFDGGSATQQLDFTALNPTAGRGDGLPAVSLAAITHLQGQLHVNYASQWGKITDQDTSPIEYQGSWSQGVRIDATFYKFLRERTNTKSISDDRTLLQRLHGNVAFYKPRIFLALKDTYHWMYTGMMASLEIALRRSDLEMAAYTNALPAGTSGPRYRPNTTYVSGIIAAVETKNRSAMARWQ